MKYLLILFVLAVALAPLSHFLPSKRQRKVARLREYAAVHGLFVEFRKFPGVERPMIQVIVPQGEIIYYGKRLRPPRGNEERRGRWVREPGGWIDLDCRGELAQAVANLPESILAAGVDDGGCGIYWQEAGEEEDVEKILAALEAWSTTLDG